jgi:hypothetical protein
VGETYGFPHEPLPFSVWDPHSRGWAPAGLSPPPPLKA